MLDLRGSLILATAAVCVQLLSAQTTPGNEPWRALSFLEGTWEAGTPKAASKIDSFGAYTFQKELGGHVLARHAITAECKAPAGYNCDHKDLLYVYQEAPGQPLKAIYFDNEGHVIHYSVSSPAPATAVFVSNPDAPGPQFRLVYELKGAVMEGKFQMRMPGKAEWNSYVEWSGKRKQNGGSPAQMH